MVNGTIQLGTKRTIFRLLDNMNLPINGLLAQISFSKQEYQQLIRKGNMNTTVWLFRFTKPETAVAFLLFTVWIFPQLGHQNQKAQNVGRVNGFSAFTMPTIVKMRLPYRFAKTLILIKMKPFGFPFLG